MRKPGDMLTVCHEPTEQVLLTDEEIMDVVIDEGLGVVADDNTRAIAKAQLKKVAKWGDERCPHPSTFGGQRLTKKKNCPECWQALLEEVK